ncbi:MAG: hypothetical protein FJ096_18900, partial [Deltaproteobacteria bacterium]|nr:hypothetical protein [Deltaproteobacteria bacterium]
CHRLGVFGEALPGQGLDVDAELRIEDTAEPFRADRSHAPDARVELCLGEGTPVELRWSGAAADLRVSLVDARWELPSLPASWPPATRAAFASGLWRRRAPTPRGLPIGQWLGVGGTTRVPVLVDPGACYLAVAAARGGEVALLRLRVGTSLEFYQDEVAEAPHAAAVTFCAGTARSARVHVELGGSQASFRLALWRIEGATP